MRDITCDAYRGHGDAGTHYDSMEDAIAAEDPFQMSSYSSVAGYEDISCRLSLEVAGFWYRGPDFTIADPA